MIVFLFIGVGIMAYGIYLYAIGERHDSEEHLLGKTHACPSYDRFECLYARSSGGLAFVAGVVMTMIGMSSTIGPVFLR